MPLIVAPFEGAHNLGDEATEERLLKTGAHKRQRIVVVLPTFRPIEPEVYLSHTNLVFPPNNGVCRILAYGEEVGEAYSDALRQVLAHPDLGTWEYLLTIEHDNTPPADGVLKLIEALEAHPEYDAVGGLYYCKGPGGCAHIWGDPKDPVVNFRPQVPRGGVQECCGLSMGFTLYRMSMFKDDDLRKPWFKTLKGDGGVSTQDLYFWADARKWGHRCAVHTDVRVGHFDLEGMGGTPRFIW